MENITDSSGMSIDNLYPALTQCFVIIICGYFAGRLNLISQTESKGINTFVGTFSLPALIFMSLAELDLSRVNWNFLLSILIAKSIVLFSVIIVTLLVRRSHKYGSAGIFAIFCTQSNDFAIGYPIVSALYKNTHPEYANYLYLMAPISLAILNPIAFIFMEIGKHRRRSSISDELLINDGEIPVSENFVKERLQMIISVARSIFTNPVILMTVLGIIGNYLFKHNVPIYLGNTLQVLGSAFSASALFLLGLRMVGKVQKLTGATLVIPGILIMVKLIVLPLITREIVSILRVGYNQSETTDWSTYGFLYGTFPSAPTVFVFANQYDLHIDLIATAMVVCTFVSAPLMFVSAKMITITSCDPSEYIKELDAFTFDVSIVGLIACFWVLAVFILTKKIWKIPHKITSGLIISQFIACFGAVLWNTINAKEGWSGYIQFTLFSIGVYSSRLWTMIIAVTLLFLQCRSLCFVLKLQWTFMVIGWGLPIILSGLLLLFDKTETVYEKKNPNFVYGSPQAITSVSLLVFCFIVTVGCLILQQKYARFNRLMDLTYDVTDHSQCISEADTTHILEASSAVSPNPSSDSGVGSVNVQKSCTLPTITEGHHEESPIIDIEDILGDSDDTRNDSGNEDQFNTPRHRLCSNNFNCMGSQRESCRGIIRQYQQQIDEDLEFIEEEPESHDPQILRHIVLLILLLCSMFVGIALSVWTLVMDEISGIYVELSFLDATLNFGQSIIAFAIFGLDTKEIVLPLLKYWRKLWYGANTLTLPSWHELSAETRHVCDQFVTHHLQNCRSAIAADKRWRLKIYRHVFSGERFVDWLMEVGLARDRTEAVNYARHLVEGKVLKHINGVYHFYDRNLLYTFV